jgi:hypothetical protein
MSENISTGSRAEFLVRIQRFTDEMLESLKDASEGKDVDEKEVRMLRFAIQKLLKIWDKALREGRRDPRLEEKCRQVEKHASNAKTGEA